MHIQVLKENLAKTIQLASKFASTRNQLPILSHILIEAGEEGIFATATSLDIGVKIRMAGKILEKGAVVVPGKLMYDLVQSLPVGSVDVKESEQGSLQVLGQRTKASVQTMNSADFPPFPTVPEMMGEWEVEALEKSLKRVGFSFSVDEARPVLTGILWKTKTGELVTTDGYRLSLIKSTGSLSNSETGIESVILPGKLFVQLFQALRDVGVEKVKYGIVEQSQQIIVAGDGFVGVVRLLSGEYPKYEAIIPEGSDLEIKVDRGQLLSAVRAAAVFARDNASIVRLKLEEGLVQVSANAPQVGEQMVEMEAEFVKEGKGTIAFNSKYLTDFLSHSEVAEIGFGMTDSLRPGLFYEVGSERYVHVIMPVRVRD